ncbi:hypothetical protein LTR29_003429 [Friedmanniomyces endolithicus]|nr:hypothetical protein LTR29_003429 [Friedmanniomyces endolithicus]
MALSEMPWTLIATGTVAIAALFISRILAPVKDAQEPPFIPTSIPLIGHLIHLLRQGAAYLSTIDKTHHHGLYTLPILTGRLYIVNSPDWALAMHKAHKTLSFNPLVVQAMRAIFAFDDPSMQVLEDNMNNERGDRSGILLEMHDMMFGAFVQQIDELNANFLRCWTPHINALAPTGKLESISLWYWLRHHFSIASAASLYGPGSPLTLNPSLENDFWLFENSIGPLFSIPYPSIFLRKAYQARQRLFDAFTEYTELDRYKLPGTSRLIQTRAEMTVRQFGLTKRMFAQGELSMMFAAVVNTVPVTFWLLSYILADRELHAEVRAEIDRCVDIASGESGGSRRRCVLNVTKLKSQCPLFNSALRETLRITATMNINRLVQDDTLLANHSTGEEFLVKKGSGLAIAANVMHFQQDIWGDDADVFNARRFLPTTEKSKSEGEGSKTADIAATFRDAKGKLHSGAFRSFGGGNNVCPGRQFAQTEIQSVVALFIAGFEIDMPDGAPYKPPPSEGSKMIAGVSKPGMDVEVQVRRRAGYEDVEWVCEM